MAEEQSNFLGRWARRKTDVLQGKKPDGPDVSQAAADSAPQRLSSALHQDRLVPTSGVISGDAQQLPAASPDAPAPALSFDDVKLLTKDSDFKPFMARNVDAGVRNAAMKKLFSNPQFNVMDGLDIYIDDYSIADPIPESMLRQMAGAKFLNLFAEEDQIESAQPGGPGNASARESANSPVAQSGAYSDHSPDIISQAHPGVTASDTKSQPESSLNGNDSSISQQDHAHTDLRLQPDHAASAPEAGRGPQ